MAEFSWQDTIGQALSVWSAVDANRQARRLEETRLQAAVYNLPARSSNPQASSAGEDPYAGAGTGNGMNLLLIGVAVVAAVLLLRS